MTARFVRRALAGGALAAAIALLPQGEAFAQDKAATSREAAGKKGAEPRKSRKQQLEEARQAQEEAEKYAVQPDVAEIFAEVREDLGAERYKQAETALRKLRRAKLSPYEQAQTYRLHGYVAYGRQDNPKAIEWLEKALAENGLPASDQADVLFQVAQIQGVEKRWKDVIATLGAWFQTVEKPNSVGYYLLALAHFQLAELDAALVPAQKAIEIAQTPQQAWLQLLLAIHLTRKDYDGATPVLVKLISFYPNSGKGYWLQLSALYGVAEANDRALAVMELAYRKGLLSEHRDLLRLVQLELLRGIPHRAADILERELAAGRIQENAEVFELLSGSFILAREVPKAEEPLARAAELSPEGDLYVRLAQVHMMQEEWEQATVALRKALDKGGLDDPANARLLLGINYFNGQELREARSWFARAQESDKTREQARTWLEHIDREMETRRTGAAAPG